MKLVAPDYFGEFACIKGACRHSCCIGWEIDIDPDSLEYYRGVPGEMGRRLAAGIETDGDAAHFRLTDDERCPFLNGDGLCDMIIELGEDSLCSICGDHPRFRNFFSDRTEIGLGLCCEAAGRLILAREAPVKLEIVQDDGGGEAADEDGEYITGLRDMLTSIIQDRSIPMEARVGRMLEAADVEMGSISAANWAKFMLGLERLEDGWTLRIENLGAGCGARPLPDMEAAFEQLMVYLLYRHMPGALEDGDVEGRIAFCAVMWRIIRAICAQEGAAMDGMIEIARQYSAEIEYSDENIDAILEEIHRVYPETGAY
jgi:lysine-N-methylase